VQARVLECHQTLPSCEGAAGGTRLGIEGSSTFAQCTVTE